MKESFEVKLARLETKFEAVEEKPQVYAENPEDVIFPIAPWL